MTAAHAAGRWVAGTEAAEGSYFILETAPTRGTGTDGGHPGSAWIGRMSTRKVDGRFKRSA